MELKEYRFDEITVNFDKKRVPLSGAQREKRQGKYRYYGAQGVIDHIDEFIFDGTYLLIAEDGENLKSKKQNIAQVVDGQFWVNNHAHIVQGNALCDTRYLCYLLNSIDLSGYVTGSAQPKLSQANLNAVTLSLPSIDMQKKIVECLYMFDQKIAVNQKINDNLQQQAFAFFDRLMIEADNDDCIVSDYADLNPRRVLAKHQIARSIDMSQLSTSGAFPSGWEMKPFNGGMRFANGDTLLARITHALKTVRPLSLTFSMKAKWPLVRQSTLYLPQERMSRLKCCTAWLVIPHLSIMQSKHEW